MSKPLSLLPIKPNHLSMLNRAGYETIGDLKGATIDSLTLEMKLSRAEASQLLETLQPNVPATGPQKASYFPVSQSASSLLASAIIHKCGIPAVDKLVNGGLRKTQCLEIAGPPGSGKKMLAFEFIRAVLEEGVEVLVLDCQNLMHPITLRETFGEGASEAIHHVSINGLADLFAFLNQLPAYLASSPSVSLLVLASLSTPFQLCPNHSTKLRLLTQLKSTLMRVGAQNGISYVVTMQLSTKLQNQDGTSANFDTGAKAVMVPALGNAWYPPQKTFKLLLYRERTGQRRIALTSSPSFPKDGFPRSLSFRVEEGGIALQSLGP